MFFPPPWLRKLSTLIQSTLFSHIIIPSSLLAEISKTPAMSRDTSTPNSSPSSLSSKLFNTITNILETKYTSEPSVRLLQPPLNWPWNKPSDMPQEPPRPSSETQLNRANSMTRGRFTKRQSSQLGRSGSVKSAKETGDIRVLQEIVGLLGSGAHYASHPVFRQESENETQYEVH